MSIANLLVQNNFNLNGNSLHILDGFSATKSADAQALSPSAATTVIFNTPIVGGPNYSTSTSIFTTAEDGYYKLNSQVQVSFGITTADTITYSFSLYVVGSGPLITSTRGMALGDGVTVNDIIPLQWYGFLNAGDEIIVQSNIPISVAHGSGNIAVYNAIGGASGGCIYFGTHN